MKKFLAFNAIIFFGIIFSSNKNSLYAYDINWWCVNNSDSPEELALCQSDYQRRGESSIWCDLNVQGSLDYSICKDSFKSRYWI